MHIAGRPSLYVEMVEIDGDERNTAARHQQQMQEQEFTREHRYIASALSWPR